MLGMVDSPHGVRFSRPPGLIRDPSRPVPEAETDKPSDTAVQPNEEAKYVSVVHPTDKPLVTDFLYNLISQMETCRFKEEDRAGGRSKVKTCPPGFPGMQCKHCHGKAGFGRYFPASIRALALANSDRNVLNHLLKCRKCPPATRKQLLMLRDIDAAKINRRGNRRAFFTLVWRRMRGETVFHHDEYATTRTTPIKTNWKQLELEPMQKKQRHEQEQQKAPPKPKEEVTNYLQEALDRIRRQTVKKTAVAREKPAMEPTGTVMGRADDQHESQEPK